MRLPLILLSIAAAAPLAGAGPVVPIVPVVPLPEPRDTHGSVVVGQSLFVVGGAVTTAWTPTASVLRAKVLSPREIGPWEPVTPLPRRTLYIGTSVVARGNRLYVVGGQNRLDERSGDSGEKVIVNRALHTTVGPDGSLGPWQETQPWPRESGLSCGAAINARALYVSGGADREDGVTDKVFFAPLDAAGVPGEWTETTALPRPLWFHQMAIHGESLFAYAGRSSSKAEGQNQSVFRSRLQADHTLGPWETLAQMNPASTFQGAYTATGNFAFGVGGKDRNWFTVNRVSFARLTPEGVGEWQTITVPDFQVERLAAAASGEIGVLFLTGGRREAGYETMTARSFAVPLRRDAALAQPPPPGCECMLPYEETLTSVRDGGGTDRIHLVTVAAGDVRSATFARTLCSRPAEPGVRRAWLDVTAGPGQALRLGMLRSGILAEIDATEKVLRRNVDPFTEALQ